jgi:hypothetical protein
MGSSRISFFDTHGTGSVCLEVTKRSMFRDVRMREIRLTQAAQLPACKGSSRHFCTSRGQGLRWGRNAPHSIVTVELTGILGGSPSDFSG